MVARNPGRYLAPVALVAVIVAVILVVRARVDHHDSVVAPAHQLPIARPTRPKATFYVIQPGDSLSSISVKTNVPVATLQSLNPSVDPDALQAGERLRLRP